MPTRVCFDAARVHADLAESQTYTVVVADAAQHTTSVPVRLIADRVPPPAPTDVSLTRFDVLSSSATITWETEEDPELAAGVSGSGTRWFEYRFKRLLADYTAWTRTEAEAFDLTGILTEIIEVQVRQVDEAGNTGQPTTVSVVLLPQPGPSPSPPPSGGTNVINVVQQFLANSNQVIARAGSEVVLRAEDGARYISLSDIDGKLSFTDVPDGVYDLLIANGPDGPEREERVTLSGNTTRAVSDVSPTSLTSTEVETCALYVEYCPFMLNDARKAIKYARRLFNRSIPPGSSGVGDVNDNTRANSFKHSYWIALMVNSIAQNFILRDDFHVALSFAEAHEVGLPDTRENRRNSAIDDHNNNVGYRLAIANSPDAHGDKHNDVFYCKRSTKPFAAAVAPVIGVLVIVGLALAHVVVYAGAIVGIAVAATATVIRTRARGLPLERAYGLAIVSMLATAAIVVVVIVAVIVAYALVMKDF